jgi:hypothetical protein
MPMFDIASGLISTGPGAIALTGHYSFPSTDPAYYSNTTNFPVWSEIYWLQYRFQDRTSNYRSIVENVFSQIGSVINIDYSEDTSGDVYNSIIHYLSSDYVSLGFTGSSALANTMPLTYGTLGGVFRDVWLSDTSTNWSPSGGWSPEKVILHETLHAFGLGHGTPLRFERLFQRGRRVAVRDDRVGHLAADGCRRRRYS